MSEYDKCTCPPLAKAVEEAITSIVSDHNEIITKWVVVAETVNQDGVMGVWTITPHGQPVWNAMGLLEFAMKKQHLHMFEDLQEG